MARRTLGNEVMPITGNMLAVLPFYVRGSESVAYLGEGVVDLLSATLKMGGWR